jgi:hypothetical protein
MREEVSAQAPGSGRFGRGLKRNGVVGPTHAVAGPISEKKGEQNSLFLQGKGAHNCQRWDKMEIPVKDSSRNCGSPVRWRTNAELAS